MAASRREPHAMNFSGSAWSQAGICGRVFSDPQAYRRSCPKMRKRLSDALAKANEIWQAKKRQRIDGSQAVEFISSPSPVAELQSNDDSVLSAHPQVRFHACSAVSVMNGSLDCQDPYSRGRLGWPGSTACTVEESQGTPATPNAILR